ncbi:MAG: TonB-dependent receptor [Cyanothece sp. SIO1E1]|nr:TonB-dependent receptor [Cyanothece sp. SIO1E1]
MLSFLHILQLFKPYLLSYFLTNAALFYRRDRWRLALNVRNLFDIDYIAATRNGRAFFNDVGTPFTIIGSVSVQF